MRSNNAGDLVFTMYKAWLWSDPERTDAIMMYKRGTPCLVLFPGPVKFDPPLVDPLEWGEKRELNEIDMSLVLMENHVGWLWTSTLVKELDPDDAEPT